MKFFKGIAPAYSGEIFHPVKVDVGSKSKNGAANLNLCLLSSYWAKRQFWLIILDIDLFCSIFIRKKFKIQKGVAAISMETERMKNV